RGPKRRLSNQDALAPIGRPRRPAREMWMRPGSAPPVNPDTAQSALPTAATARESAAARLAQELGGLGWQATPAPKRETREPATAGTLESVYTIEALRAPRHAPKCS